MKTFNDMKETYTPTTQEKLYALGLLILLALSALG